LAVRNGKFHRLLDEKSKHSNQVKLKKSNDQKYQNEIVKNEKAN
jgi:hypothetical protein